MVLLILLALTSGVAVLLGLMVMGLFEAPWPVLLSLLCLGFWGLQRLAAHAKEWDSSLDTLEITTNSAAEVSSESETDNGVVCTYRGVKYRASSASQPATNESTADEPTTVTEGVYRGQPWRRSNTDSSKQTPPSSESSTELKYRGHSVKK